MTELEIPSCPVCQEEFCDVVPMILGCGHTICRDCLNQLVQQAGRADQMKCPTCRKPNGLSTPTKNYGMEDAISAIKKMKEKPKTPANFVGCSGCDKMVGEADLFVCQNCTRQTFGCEIDQIDVDLKSLVICANCFLKNHAPSNHKTIPYLQISTGFHVENHLTGVTIMKKELDQNVAVSNTLFAEHKTTVSRAFEEIDKMTEMMRKGKSGDVQREFAQRIEEECSKLAMYVTSVADCIREGDENYLVGFNELVAKNLQDEVAKCQETVSKMTDAKCTVCKNKSPTEKMLCCRTCSEVAEALMSDQIDSSNIMAVDLNSLPICRECAIDNHMIHPHHMVKFTELQEKFRIAEDTSRLHMKEDQLNQKFAVLLQTFRQYVNLVETYDIKITRMAKIASESHGHPQQQTVLENLEFSLGEAETAMRSLQMHAERHRHLLEVNTDALTAMQEQLGTI